MWLSQGVLTIFASDNMRFFKYPSLQNPSYKIVLKITRKELNKYKIVIVIEKECVYYKKKNQEQT